MKRRCPTRKEWRDNHGLSPKAKESSSGSARQARRSQQKPKEATSQQKKWQTGWSQGQEKIATELAEICREAIFGPGLLASGEPSQQHVFDINRMADKCKPLLTKIQSEVRQPFERLLEYCRGRLSVLDDLEGETEYDEGDCSGQIAAYKEIEERLCLILAPEVQMVPKGK